MINRAKTTTLLLVLFVLLNELQGFKIVKQGTGVSIQDQLAGDQRMSQDGINRPIPKFEPKRPKPSRFASVVRGAVLSPPKPAWKPFIEVPDTRRPDHRGMMPPKRDRPYYQYKADLPGWTDFDEMAIDGVCHRGPVSPNWQTPAFHYKALPRGERPQDVLSAELWAHTGPPVCSGLLVNWDPEVCYSAERVEVERAGKKVVGRSVLLWPQPRKPKGQGKEGKRDVWGLVMAVFADDDCMDTLPLDSVWAGSTGMCTAVGKWTVTPWAVDDPRRGAHTVDPSVVDPSEGVDRNWECGIEDVLQWTTIRVVEDRNSKIV